jgi:hypothetical protein
MAQTEHGKKGFQSIAKEQQKTTRGYYYLTASEMKRFKSYCKDKNIKPSILVRDMIKDRMKHFKHELEHNPNQLTIE